MDYFTRIFFKDFLKLSFFIQDQSEAEKQCDDLNPSFSDDDDVLQRVHDSESIRLSSSAKEVSNKDDQEKQQHQYDDPNQGNLLRGIVNFSGAACSAVC